MTQVTLTVVLEGTCSEERLKRYLFTALDDAQERMADDNDIDDVDDDERCEKTAICKIESREWVLDAEQIDDESDDPD